MVFMAELVASLNHHSHLEGAYHQARVQSIIVGALCLVVFAGMGPRPFVRALTIAAVVIVLRGAYDVYSGDATGLRREVFGVSAPFAKSNGVNASDGKLAAVVIAMVGLRAIFYGRIRYWTLALLLVSVVLLQSRSQVLAVFVCASVFALMAKPGPSTFIAVAFAFLLWFRGDLDSIISAAMGEGVLVDNVVGRGVVYQDVIGRWMSSLDSVLFGGGVEAATATYHGKDLAVHNTFLFVGARSGVLAVFALFMAVAISIGSVLRARRRVSNHHLRVFVAVSSAIICEHLLYPGFYNEVFIIWFSIVPCVVLDCSRGVRGSVPLVLDVC